MAAREEFKIRTRGDPFDDVVLFLGLMAVILERRDGQNDRVAAVFNLSGTIDLADLPLEQREASTIYVVEPIAPRPCPAPFSSPRPRHWPISVT